MTRTSPPSAVLAEANKVNTVGPIVINYSRTSITGRPVLTYRDADLNLSFSGPEITRVLTVVGELVTVTLDEVIDAFVRTFTLVVPTIRLARGQEVMFDTIGFETIDTSSAFVPAPGPSGALQTYRLHQLRGAAKLVDF